ncbi:MAG: hypothetical protein IKN00_04235 [Bacteroidales bacterium]|nr:hypothetical protein [Bacteroidales bacterium]
MTRIVRLKDGTEIPIRMCGENAGSLWIDAEIGFGEAYRVFGDPAKTEFMVDTYAENDELRSVVWEGYTRLWHLQEQEGWTQVGLKEAAE